MAKNKKAGPQRKGSFLRGGATIVATGVSSAVAITTLNSGTLTWAVSEDCIAEYLVSDHEETPACFTDVKLNNDSLVTGFVPVSMFGYLSLVNPKFGHYLEVNDSVTATVYNPTGGTLTFDAAWSSAPVAANAVQAFRGSMYRKMRGGGFRSLVAIGGPSPTTIGISSSSTLTFSIAEPGHLGRMVIGQDQDWDDLAITSIKLNNDELVQGRIPASMFRAGNPHSPLFGHYVNTSSKLTVTVANAHAVATPIVAVGFSVL